MIETFLFNRIRAAQELVNLTMGYLDLENKYIYKSSWKAK